METMMAQFQSRREAEQALRNFAAELGALWDTYLERYVYSNAQGQRYLKVVASERRKGWWAIIKMSV